MGWMPRPTSLSRAVCLSRLKDREEFEELLNDALAIDPDDAPENRLLTLISQKRASLLLDHVDDLFFEPLAEAEEENSR